jgi:hypothetical protein
MQKLRLVSVAGWNMFEWPGDEPDYCGLKRLEEQRESARQRE